MKIELAKSAGFCFGVNRAVNMLYDMVEKGEKVCTLGPIIHNPQVIDDLKNKGVEIVNSVSEIPKDTKLVVRTHGVEKSVIDELEKGKFDYCDATCPFVKKIHKIVTDNSSPEIPVFIAGDENHPEVQGIRSYCKGKSLVFFNAKELDKIVKNDTIYRDSKVVVVSQTTFNTVEWKKCLEILKKHYTNALIFDTICNATNERQEEAIKIAENSDAMIIVGGRQSSNTGKLKAVCENCCPTYLIETADELSNIDLSGVRKVGVTAGASTPAVIIKEVLSTMSENLTEIEKGVAEDIEFIKALEESLNNMSTEQKVTGIVTAISPSEIQVDIGRKQTGYIPVDEYSADPTADPLKELNIGDELNLIIMKTNDQEGTVMLSKKRYDAQGAWDKVEAVKESNETVTGTVTDIVKGGVIAVVFGLRIFIPGSLTGLAKNAPLDELKNQKIDFKIIEVKAERGRKKAIGSVRAVIREARKAKAEEFWANIEEGKQYTGVVRSMTTYGAFVDLGGVDGMIHISEISWKRIKHPSEVLELGQEIEVFVKSFDAEAKKISLGYKKDEDNPWAILRRDYPVDTVIESEIVGLTTFGAFATVIPGIDGLIHISQISNEHINKPADVLKIGDKVTCKITEIDFDKSRVSLSIRALLPEKEEIIEALADETPAETETETVAEEAVENVVEEVVEQPTEETVEETTAE